MVMTATPQTYHHLIEYGMRKTSLRFDRLLLQAFMAGVYVGMAGNGSIGFAGGQYTNIDDPRVISSATQKFLFASIFPTAFIAIIFTGAELFTGNTMTMLICLFERKITILHVIINWTGSFIGNWLGTLFSAYFLTYLCCNYDKEPYITYLEYTAEAKVSYGFFNCFLRGIGCNTLVCLAVWNVIATDDAAGKILSMWFPIVTFVCAGYEHIIANMYTLQLAMMLGAKVSVGQVVLHNFLPTLLGNLVGGCGLLGTVYWYNFYPVEHYGNAQEEHSSISVDNLKGSFYNQPISRVISRSSVSPSVVGMGTKPVETFGGIVGNTTWKQYGSLSPTGPQLRQVQNIPSVANSDAAFPREANLLGGNCEVVTHIEGAGG